MPLVDQVPVGGNGLVGTRVRIRAALRSSLRSEGPAVQRPHTPAVRDTQRHDDLLDQRTPLGRPEAIVAARPGVHIHARHAGVAFGLDPSADAPARSWIASFR